MTHPLFTPTDVSGERLRELTVGRQDILARLSTRISDIATTTARPHTLIVGPRGSGKTHLLSLAVYQATRHPDVADRILVAQIAEDAIGIDSYPDLLVELIRSVRPSAVAEAQDLRRTKQIVALEQLLLDCADGRAVLLVVENLDRVFSALGTAGQRALRGLVETSGQIAVLASTPLLFHDVATRSEPWFGSFDVDHLDDLNLEDGTRLLRHLATERGDETLAEFLGQPQGQSRLAAVAHLAGGSPRLWHILSGCLTVDALDELIPAIKALLEQLTPYYQQRLWELPPTEQRLVLTLARADGGVTVTALSEESGVERPTTATTLNRLAEAGWVRGAKWPGTDQRSTFYELREPLLRHHLQYRESRGGTLQLIVTILRSWFTTRQREILLGSTVLGELAETYLAQSILTEATRSSMSVYRDRDVQGLLAEVRLWKQVAIADRTGSPALAKAIEKVCQASQDETIGNNQLLDQSENVVCNKSVRAADYIDQGLVRLGDGKWSIRDHAALRLITICWNNWVDPADARRQLAELLNYTPSRTDRLGFQIRAALASFTGDSGEAAEAYEQLRDLVVDQVRMLGVDHPAALGTRRSLAHWLGMVVDPAAAVHALRDLLADQVRVLGADHPATLGTRNSLALSLGDAGDPSAAAALQDLLRDMLRVLGADHPDVLANRLILAHWRGNAGAPAAAVQELQDLLRDQLRVLGAESRNTVGTRQLLAHWRGKAGDPAAAVQGLQDLLSEQVQVLGPDHRATVRTRQFLADWRGKVGDPAPTVQDLGPPLQGTDQAQSDAKWLGVRFQRERSFEDAGARLGRDRALAGLSELAKGLEPSRIPALIAWVEPQFREAAAATLIVNIPLGAQQRTALLTAAQLQQESLPWRMHRALDGDGAAIAGLPEEIRRLLTVRSPHLK